MALVAVVALGLAGMTSASKLWTAAASTVTLALLLGAILAACLLDRLDRAFWAGFALFGWTYLVLVNWDWIGGQFGHDLTPDLSAIAERVVWRPAPPIQATSAFPPMPLPVAPPVPPAAQPGGALSPTRPVPSASLAPPGRVPPMPAPAFSAPVVDFELHQQRQIKVGNVVQIIRMILAIAFAFVGGYIGRALAEKRERDRGPGLSGSPG
jgi:hypothetical protein